jgi:hypothetical protein
VESKKDSNPFQVAKGNLGYLPFKTSVSPNFKNEIEFRRLTYLKGSTRYDYSSPVRVYYGVKGTELTKYKEFKTKAIKGYHHFEIYWSGDPYVMIDVIGENENGTTHVMERMGIEMKE